MELSQIISIAGKPGLHQIISQSRGGVIVSSLDTGKKMAVGQTQRVSALSDISIYTMDGDILLKEIFERVYAHTNGGAIEIDLKDDETVRDFFTEVVPEHDDSRVYHSDIRKLIKWFNSLLAKDLLSMDSGTQESEAAPEEGTTKDVVAKNSEEPAVNAEEAKTEPEETATDSEEKDSEKKDSE